MQPIRVLQGVVANDKGGLTGYICQNYRYINRDKVQFDFLTYDDKLDFEAEFRAMGARFFRVPRPSHSLAYWRAMRELCRTAQDDILHLNMSYANVVQIALARLAGFRHIIVHSHSTNFDEPHALVRGLKYVVHYLGRLSLPYLADTYLACSHLAARWMYPDAIVRPQHYTVANNAIDIERFAYDPAVRERKRRELGIRQAERVIGHVGRFTYQKNHAFLLDVFAAVVQEQPQVRLLLIGDGPQRQAMEAKAARLGIRDKVLFLGQREDVNELYQAMDCFVIPSRFEGLCIAAVEAQTSGIQCICSNALFEETNLSSNYQTLSLHDPIERWKEAVITAMQEPHHDNRHVIAGWGILSPARDQKDGTAVPADRGGQRPLRIVYYYWMQYNDVNKRGGGVQVYLRNIIRFFAQNPHMEIVTLSAGTAYDIHGKCYVRRLGQSGNVTQYEVVNSPMLAPTKASFYQQDIYLHDDVLSQVIGDFLQQLGHVDVVHFQSLEGLTLQVMSLKQQFPQTKFVLSLHNYHCFCPQGNLWYAGKESCDDYQHGTKCLRCLGGYPSSHTFLTYYRLDYFLRRVGLSRYSGALTRRAKGLHGWIKKHRSVSNHTAKPDASLKEVMMFRAFREQDVQAINQYMDTVLCVSRRVQAIAQHMGVRPELTQVSYIGTAFAETQKMQSAYPYTGGILTLAYMGYMRHDKGFYFLLEALEQMPADLAGQLDIVIAARYDDMAAVQRLEALQGKFHAIRLYNGYTHAQIPEITRHVNLGLVPVLWEDNLPQVAIEFKAMGIPVLASDKGGASELSASTFFRFHSGDCADFCRKIRAISQNGHLLDDYWNQQQPLVSMASHGQDLVRHYLFRTEGGDGCHATTAQWKIARGGETRILSAA